MLTVGTYPYISDPRFQALHAHHTEVSHIYLTDFCTFRSAALWTALNRSFIPREADRRSLYLSIHFGYRSSMPEKLIPRFCVFFNYQRTGLCRSRSQLIRIMGCMNVKCPASRRSRCLFSLTLSVSSEACHVCKLETFTNSVPNRSALSLPNR